MGGREGKLAGGFPFFFFPLFFLWRGGAEEALSSCVGEGGLVCNVPAEGASVEEEAIMWK